MSVVVPVTVMCECGREFVFAYWSEEEFQLHKELPAKHVIGTERHRLCGRVVTIYAGNVRAKVAA